jgi:hypothetical protein
MNANGFVNMNKELHSPVTGYFGVLLVLVTLSGIAWGMYSYKLYMENNNYSIIPVEIPGGCAGCGIVSSIGGFAVGMGAILGLMFVVLLILVPILGVSFCLLAIGFKLIQDGFGNEAANVIMNIFVIVFLGIILYLISSLVGGEMQAAIEGRI